MDDHFEQMLAPGAKAAPRPDFIASSGFTGKKTGYIFKKDVKGLGYYRDLVFTAKDTQVPTADALDRKRKRDVEEQEEGEGEEKQMVSAPISNKNTIEKMLEDAEAMGVSQLDPTSLKQLLLSFEKKITKNQKMRMKHPDEPEKFMETELELHAEINELYAIAASPELYPTLVEAGSVVSILGTITHENTDISIASVGLIHEMTDVDTIAEEESAMCFIDALLEQNGLELIVQNLSRLDESNEEDVQGVYFSMGCIENLVEIRPDIALLICEKTQILKFLLLRLKIKKFDGNKLYCSEILSILLQAHDLNQKRVCDLTGLDGMDSLLQTVALYRKKDPATMDEEECMENLFQCVCTTLLLPENQDKFLKCEGMELMVRCLKEQKHASMCALRVVKYACSHHQKNCEKFVSVGGLKYVFPALMGRGLVNHHGAQKKDMTKHEKSVHDKAVSQAAREMEEAAIAVISSLVGQLHDCEQDDIRSRLLLKFTENEGEKLERCSELFVKFVGVLQTTEQQLEATALALQEAGDDDALADFCSAENTYAQRLSGGLFVLQMLSTIIVFVCVHDTVPGAGAASGVNKSIEKVQIKLGAEGLSLSDVLDVLRESAIQLNATADENASSSASGTTGSSSSSSSSSASSSSRWTEGTAAKKKLSRNLTEWVDILSPLAVDEDEDDVDDEEEDKHENGLTHNGEKEGIQKNETLES